MKYQVVDIAGRGRALVAVEPIIQGELVLSEEAIFNASNVRSDGRTRSSANSGDYDMVFMERQVSLLCPSDLALFLALHDPEPSGHPDLKHQRIYCNNTFHDGLFMGSARMNHSCSPNVLLSSDDGFRNQVVAVRDISAGEEITVSYLRTSYLETRDERMSKLQEHWQFQCCCLLCSLPNEEVLQNDLARQATRFTLERVAKLFDSLWRVDCKVTRAVAAPLLQSITLQAIEALHVLESGELEGQADTALLLVLQQLAELASFSDCGRFQEKKELKETVGQESRAEHYQGRARGLAKGMGDMFLSNCTTVDREIRELNIDFV